MPVPRTESLRRTGCGLLSVRIELHKKAGGMHTLPVAVGLTVTRCDNGRCRVDSRVNNTAVEDFKKLTGYCVDKKDQSIFSNIASVDVIRKPCHERCRLHHVIAYI